MGTSSDRKSTRLNSSHQIISYAVFCLKKKKPNLQTRDQKRVVPMLITMRYMFWLSITYRRVLLKVLQKYPTQNTKARSFFFNDTATTEIYTLSLHDALPI